LLVAGDTRTVVEAVGTPAVVEDTRVEEEGVAGLRVVVVDTLKQVVGTQEVDIRSARFGRPLSVSPELASSHTPRMPREWVGPAARFMVLITRFTPGTQWLCIPTRPAKTGLRVLQVWRVTLEREPKWRSHTAMVL